MKNFFALLVLLTLLAIFVWPTRYQYYEPGARAETVAEGLGSDSPIRVDRITGAIEAQGVDGEWHEIGNSRRAVAFERPAVDPGVTKRPSLEENERVVSQGQQSVDRTQAAVNQQTQK